MNEEEKRAIEWLNNANFFSARIYAPVLLSLIEKQDKEIENQKDLYEILLNGYNERVKEIEELEKEKEHWKDETASFLNKCFEKDKEIKELKKENFDTVYIQAIENYKAKIRAKIKELEELKEKYFEKQIIQGRIDLLKELLEE